jgi:hypothetical protein
MPNKYVPLTEYRYGQGYPMPKSDYGLEVLDAHMVNLSTHRYRCKWCKQRVTNMTKWVCVKEDCKALSLMIDGGWWGYVA